MLYKVHFKFNNNLTKSETYTTKEIRKKVAIIWHSFGDYPAIDGAENKVEFEDGVIRKKQMQTLPKYIKCDMTDKHRTLRDNETPKLILKGGPMRTILSTSRYTALMHGLTRHGKHGMEIFKGFSSVGFTFTNPTASFIRKESERKIISRDITEKQIKGDVMSEKIEKKPVGRKNNNELRYKMRRKLNIGMRSYGIIDKHILVRGAFLRKGELGKPPMPKNHILGGV